MFPAKLKEGFQENFDGELEVKCVKIVGFHVPRTPLQERLAYLPFEFDKTLLYKTMSAFLVIDTNSFFFQRIILISKITHFYE